MHRYTYSPSYSLASKDKRLLALIIDIVVWTLLLTAVFLGLYGMSFSDSDGYQIRYSGKTYAPFVLIGSVMFLAKDCINGISLGKWMVGIRVRNEHDPTSTPSVIKLFLRNIPLIVWPLEVFALYINPDKQRFGDIMAKTIVVEYSSKRSILFRLATLLFVLCTSTIIVVVKFYQSVLDSEVYALAIRQIKDNENIMVKTGGIKGFGVLPSGNLYFGEDTSGAYFKVKVLGKDQNAVVHIYLSKEQNGTWQVVKMQEGDTSSLQ